MEIQPYLVECRLGNHKTSSPWRSCKRRISHVVGAVGIEIQNGRGGRIRGGIQRNAADRGRWCQPGTLVKAPLASTTRPTLSTLNVARPSYKTRIRMRCALDKIRSVDGQIQTDIFRSWSLTLGKLVCIVEIIPESDLITARRRPPALDEIKSENVARLDLKPAVPTLAMLLPMTPMALPYELNPVTAVNIDVRNAHVFVLLVTVTSRDRFTDSANRSPPGYATAVVSAWSLYFEPTLGCHAFPISVTSLDISQLRELRRLRDERIIFQGFQRVLILKLCHEQFEKNVFAERLGTTGWRGGGICLS